MMRQTQMLIRQASARDITRLIELRAYLIDIASTASYASRSAYQREAWKTSYNQWLLEVYGTSDHLQILVCEIDGEIVGCATGIVDRRPPAPDCLSGWCGWVQSVVVSPQWRRQGVAEQVMKTLLNWFAEQSVSKIILEATHEAEHLYKKLGFIRSPEGLFTKSEATS